MDQGHPINNRTVKFVVSCCIVSKQVEVSTILESVESNWMICILPGLSAFYLKKWLSEVKWYNTHFSQQHSMERVAPCNISFNKQVHTIPHPALQVPACSQEAVDSTDTNIGNKKYRYILRTIQRVLGKCWVGEQKLLSPSHTLIYSSSYFCICMCAQTWF